MKAVPKAVSVGIKHQGDLSCEFANQEDALANMNLVIEKVNTELTRLEEQRHTQMKEAFKEALTELGDSSSECRKLLIIDEKKG